MATSRTLLASSLLVVLGACGAATPGGSSFSISYPATPRAGLAAVAARVAASPAPALPAVVVLTPPPPAQGFSIHALPGGNRLGQVGAAVDVRPVVLGDLVVSHVPGRVVAWTLDGREAWSVGDEGLALNGAARDGEHVVLTLGGNGVTRRQGALLMVDSRGGVRVRARVPHALGQPAVAGSDAFVPWDGQNLSVFDLGSGDEVARLRSRDDVYAFATRAGRGVFFGARVLYRLAPEAADGRRESTPHWRFTREDLPGLAPFSLDGYVTLRTGLNARERVRLAWRPDPDAAAPAVLDRAAYALFHRVVFALDANDGAVRWAYTHPADIAGIEPVRGGVALVDEQGNAALLDAANGQRVWQAALGAPAVQAVLQLPETFRPPGADAPAPATPEATLREAASGTDTRLLPARLFAVRALAARDSAEATRALVEVATQRAFPQELRAAAGEALARRTQGADAMTDALGAHYDFVRRTDAPPVGWLARGIATAGERRAVPALLAHLRDPATPVEELAPLVAALRSLADPAALPGLVDFVRLYHADVGAVPPVGPGDPVDDRTLEAQSALQSALEQAVAAIARLGGPTEQRLLDDVLGDSETPASLRVAVARIRGGGDPDAPRGDAAGASAAPQDTSGLPPARLGPEQIEQAFMPRRDELMGCLRGAQSRPSQLRIQFHYDSEGRISHTVVTPTSFQSCMRPIVEAVQLPPSGVGREIGTYFLIGGIR